MLLKRGSKALGLALIDFHQAYLPWIKGKVIRRIIPRNHAAEEAGLRHRLYLYRRRTKNSISMSSMPLGHIGDRVSIPRTENADVVEFTIQRHIAKKAGPHYDVRIIVGDKAYSWATKKEFPRRPGRMIGLFLQPVHSREYSFWEGEIEEGYGAGKVSVWDKGRAIVKSSDVSENGFKIQFFGDKLKGHYAFVPSKQGWMMIRMKPLATPKLIPRNEYTSKIPAEFWDDPDLIVENKIDGANFHAVVTPRGIQYISRRESVDGKPIDRSDAIPHLRDIKLPKKYHGTILRGELALVKKSDTGLWVSSYETTSGMLNSLPPNAVESQNRLGKISFFPFEIIKSPLLKRSASYGERRELLREIVGISGSEHMKLPEGTSEDKKGFYQKVLASSVVINGNKRIGEGVVFKDLKGDRHTENFKWGKQKGLSTFDLKVVGFTEGTGRLIGKGVGAFIVQDRSGRTVGKVGTGITDEERIDAMNNPDKYLGQIMEVKATQVTSAGFLRAPRLVRWRPDKISVDKVEPESVSPSNRDLPHEIRMEEYARASNPWLSYRGIKQVMYRMKSSKGWRK